jgi:hypothetical protein
MSFQARTNSEWLRFPLPAASLAGLPHAMTMTTWAHWLLLCFRSVVAPAFQGEKDLDLADRLFYILRPLASMGRCLFKGIMKIKEIF